MSSCYNVIMFRRGDTRGPAHAVPHVHGVLQGRDAKLLHKQECWQPGTESFYPWEMIIFVNIQILLCNYYIPSQKP